MRTDAGSNLKSKIQSLVDTLDKQDGEENIDELELLRSQIYIYGYKPNV